MVGFYSSRQKKMQRCFLSTFILIASTFASECEVDEWTVWGGCFGDCIYGQQAPPRRRWLSSTKLFKYRPASSFFPAHESASSTEAPPLLQHSFGDAIPDKAAIWTGFARNSESEHHISSLDSAPFPSPPPNPFPTLIPGLRGSQRSQQRGVPILHDTTSLSLLRRYPHRLEPQEHFTLGAVLFSTTPSIREHLETFSTIARKEHQHGDKKSKQYKPEDDLSRVFGWSHTPSEGAEEVESSSSTPTQPQTTTVTAYTSTIPKTTVVVPWNPNDFEDITDTTRGNFGDNSIVDGIVFVGAHTTPTTSTPATSTTTPAPTTTTTPSATTTTSKPPKTTTPARSRYTTSTTESSTDIQLESTTRGMWQRDSHFVPNTRQHASEITNQLYLTGEIVQASSLVPDNRRNKPNPDCEENPRCCSVTRTTCPDGSEPTFVKRYYRPLNSKDCIPYRYPRCDRATEMEEQPIQYSQNCQDLCFPIAEKQISPLFILSSEV